MKKLVLAISLALSSQLVQAQPSSAPPVVRPASDKDDDTVLIDLTGSPEASWRQLAQVLVSRNYSIEHSDKDLLMLSTHLLNQAGNFPVRVTGMVVNRTVVLRMWETRADIAILRVRRRGGESKEWLELEAIARDLGGVVRYASSPVQ